MDSGGAECGTSSNFYSLLLDDSYLFKCFAYIMAQWLVNGSLTALEQIGSVFSGQSLLLYSITYRLKDGVPVNLKNEDSFHITIEEYLHALVSLTEELARLAVNAVTLGDYERPLQISKFVKVKPIDDQGMELQGT